MKIYGPFHECLLREAGDDQAEGNYDKRLSGISNVKLDIQEQKLSHN